MFDLYLSASLEITQEEVEHVATHLYTRACASAEYARAAYIAHITYPSAASPCSLPQRKVVAALGKPDQTVAEIMWDSTAGLQQLRDEISPTRSKAPCMQWRRRLAKYFKVNKVLRPLLKK